MAAIYGVYRHIKSKKEEKMGGDDGSPDFNAVKNLFFGTPVPASSWTAQDLDLSTVAPECVPFSDPPILLGEGPISRNTVILLSTLNSFPWSQIPAAPNEIRVKVSCYIGAQTDTSFLIVGTSGFEVGVIDYALFVIFGGTTVNLGRIEDPPDDYTPGDPLYPLGPIKVFVKVQRKWPDPENPGPYAITAYAEADKQREIGSFTDDIGERLSGLPMGDTKMYEGKVAYLETSVSWA